LRFGAPSVSLLLFDSIAILIYGSDTIFNSDRGSLRNPLSLAMQKPGFDSNGETPEMSVEQQWATHEVQVDARFTNTVHRHCIGGQLRRASSAFFELLNAGGGITQAISSGSLTPKV
jgi:hypothetical protein